MATDYSDTLNLPKTDFSMRANLPKREPEILKFWEEKRINQKINELRKGKDTFILHDGPPYANGDIHMGTALNKILKDILIKYKTMCGLYAPFIPGWDTHGLPIEHQIIKTKNIKREDISLLKFRHMCRDYALEYVDIQREQFKRLGVRGDWDNPYLTLDPQFEAKQIEVFGEMAKKGYIYKGLKPVFWCPVCETAMAEAEIDYKNRRSPSITVRFKIVDDRNLFGGVEPVYCLIWTTTPWTIPANMAISLHPDFDYALIKTQNDDYYLLAEYLVPLVMEELNINSYQIKKRYKGVQLEGIKYRHPFYERDLSIILGEHVTLEQGTGCVHTAPGHGQEDYEIGLKYNLPVFSPMDNRGVFTEEAGQFACLRYDEVDKVVISTLEERGDLLRLSVIEHQYPHCWRCKKPVLFRATEQWFVSIEGFRDAAIRSINDVRWIPRWGRERIHNMIADRQDWCISRQRVWGVPIPIFYCEDCGEPLINDRTIRAVRDLFAREGSDAWYVYPASKILPKEIKCSSCNGNNFRKEEDIMDVWFDSGSSHAVVCENREELSWPADLYLEGSDQYRGWFQSSLLTSVAIYNKPPYRMVLSHGWVVDGEGKKMSKSMGNVIAPDEIIKNYGADILRLWVSSADFTSDVHLSPRILKQLVEVYRKIRNTCRFMLGNLYDFELEQHQVKYENLEEIDRWVLGRMQQLIQTVSRAYEDFEYHQVFHAIHNFCVVDMSNFYLDIIKDRLYCMEKTSSSRRAAQTVLNNALQMLIKLIAPILTFTSEELWQKLKDREYPSVQMATWPEICLQYINDGLMKRWETLIEVRNIVTKALEEARGQKIIGSSLEATVELFPDEKNYDLLITYEKDLADIFIVSRCLLHRPSGKFSEESTDPEQLNVKVIIKKAVGEKCGRCWIFSETVGSNSNFPDVCHRCYNVLRKKKI